MLGDNLLFDRVGVLRVWRKLEVLLVGVACGLLVAHLVLCVAEPEERLRERRIEARRVAEAVDRSFVLALFEIEVADLDVVLRFEGIERILARLDILVFFRRSLLLHNGFGRLSGFVLRLVLLREKRGGQAERKKQLAWHAFSISGCTSFILYESAYKLQRATLAP